MSALFNPSIIIDTKILDCKVGQEVGENVGIAVGMLPINVYEDAVDISVTCEYRGKLKVEYVQALRAIIRWSKKLNKRKSRGGRELEALSKGTQGNLTYCFLRDEVVTTLSFFFALQKNCSGTVPSIMSLLQ